jgi:excisionase family DNA binding protein
VLLFPVHPSDGFRPDGFRPDGCRHEWTMGERVREHGICAARVRTASARQYSAEEAARLVGRSARAIRRWIREGRVRAERYGEAYVISASDLPIARHRRLSGGLRAGG